MIGHALARRVGRRLRRALSGARTSSPDEFRVHREWSIGIYGGLSPYDIGPLETARNPVLTAGHVTDVPAAYVADPFTLKMADTWFMFFEVMNRRTGKGEIGCAASADGVAWAYEGIVLAESFHLSYPYTFTHDNEQYMIPECQQAGAVRLYRASRFPSKWRCVGYLLKGPCLLDPSVIRYNNWWWLFVETNPSFRYDTLRLFHAGDLLGPWTEHPDSPVVDGNGHVARPAGRVVEVDGSVVRYAQDCDPVYGTGVRAVQITELSTRRYRERSLRNEPVLSAGEDGWNQAGMHHVDAHRLGDGRWIAAVDGWRNAE